jgi:hypothetical protein
MWICPYCNQLVPNPVNRKCPNGHAMEELLILGWTVENTLGKSFLRAFLISLGIAVLIMLSRFFLPEKTVGHSLGMALVFITSVGVVALWRALKWKRQGGPVTRLIPRAVGTGLGYILVGGGLLATGFAIGMIN